MAVVEHEIQTVEMKPSLRELFKRAADILEEEDWCQGMFKRDSEICVLEALRAAARNLGLPATPTIPGYPELSERVGENIVDWQDTPGRTKEEVVALLREAAYA